MSLDSVLQSFYDTVVAGACCSSCPSCDYQTQCDIHAAVTQTCAIQNVDISHCSDVNVICCNSNDITILSCPSQSALQQYAINAVEQAIAENTGLAAEIRAFLERNSFLTPAEAIELGISAYFNNVCSMAVIETQSNALPMLKLYGCSDVLIDLFNRSDLTVQCVAAAISNLVYPAGSSSSSTTTVHLTPLARDLAIGMTAAGGLLLAVAIGLAACTPRAK